MAKLHPKASYVEFAFPKEEWGRILRALYERAFPGKYFGMREWRLLTVHQEDREFIFQQMEALGLTKKIGGLAWDGGVTTRSVFLDSEITEEEKLLLESQGDFAVARACRVCNNPMFSGAHKHRLEFCKTCQKETEHTTPFFGHPFRCTICRH